MSKACFEYLGQLAISQTPLLLLLLQQYMLLRCAAITS
jgi:hypothetical protein